MKFNSKTVRLGRKPARHDPRTLKLAKYLPASALPALPAAVDWGKGTANWGMMLNDQYGDCTAAGAGHMVRLWNDRAGHSVIVTDKQVLALYEAVTAEEGGRFNPATGANDNGCNEIDVLKYLRKTGIGGHKIEGFASVTPTAHEYIKAAISFFGGSYIGINLPLAAQNQATWDVPAGKLTGRNAPGSWGGHCVILTAYDANGLTCITWGSEKRLTWRWLDAYCEEAYALLSPDWIGAGAVSPGNFNLEQLRADLAAL